jgi:Zn-dependent protease
MLGDNIRSLKIFTWLGIPVFLHWSFFLIFLYALYIGYDQNMSTESIIWLMGFFMAMFGCVLLHEYGHSLAARRYGVVTHDIILTPLGGMARLARIPEKPIQEFIVAIAGPLVNIVIAVVLYAFGKLFYRGDDTELFSFFMGEPSMEMTGLIMFIPLLIWTNLSLFFFNLLPAFPMDGGRIFRSLMALKFGRVRATKFAMWLGQVMAVLFIGFGIYSSNITLAAIGIFVITTARAEYKQVKTSSLVRNFTARDLVRYQYTTFNQFDWMQSAYELLLHGHERSFLVQDMQGNQVGILHETAILKAKAENALSQPVERFMTFGAPSITTQTKVEEIMAYLNHPQTDLLIVHDPYTREVVGVIDDMSLEYFMSVTQIS